MGLVDQAAGAVQGIHASGPAFRKHRPRSLASSSSTWSRTGPIEPRKGTVSSSGTNAEFAVGKERAQDHRLVHARAFAMVVMGSGLRGYQ